MGDSDSDLLKRAREATAVRDWETAHRLLTEADASGLVTPPDLAWLAEVAYAAGHLDATIDAWERLHAVAVRGGDDPTAAAAAVRVALHLLIDTALMAPVRGWLSRAERLLQQAEPTAVRAWFAVARGYERLLSGDAGAASEWARQAIDIGARFDPGAAAVGRVAHARCLIISVKVREDLKALVEAEVSDR